MSLDNTEIKKNSQQEQAEQNTDDAPVEFEELDKVQVSNEDLPSVQKVEGSPDALETLLRFDEKFNELPTDTQERLVGIEEHIAHIRDALVSEEPGEDASLNRVSAYQGLKALEEIYNKEDLKSAGILDAQEILESGFKKEGIDQILLDDIDAKYAEAQSFFQLLQLSEKEAYQKYSPEQAEQYHQAIYTYKERQTWQNEKFFNPVGSARSAVAKKIYNSLQTVATEKGGKIDKGIVAWALSAQRELALALETSDNKQDKWGKIGSIIRDITHKGADIGLAFMERMARRGITEKGLQASAWLTASALTAVLIAMESGLSDVAEAATHNNPQHEASEHERMSTKQEMLRELTEDQSLVQQNMNEQELEQVLANKFGEISEKTTMQSGALNDLLNATEALPNAENLGKLQKAYDALSAHINTMDEQEEKALSAMGHAEARKPKWTFEKMGENLFMEDKDNPGSYAQEVLKRAGDFLENNKDKILAIEPNKISAPIEIPVDQIAKVAEVAGLNEPQNVQKARQELEKEPQNTPADNLLREFAKKTIKEYEEKEPHGTDPNTPIVSQEQAPRKDPSAELTKIREELLALDKKLAQEKMHGNIQNQEEIKSQMRELYSRQDVIQQARLETQETKEESNVTVYESNDRKVMLEQIIELSRNLEKIKNSNRIEEIQNVQTQIEVLYNKLEKVNAEAELSGKPQVQEASPEQAQDASPADSGHSGASIPQEASSMDTTEKFLEFQSELSSKRLDYQLATDQQLATQMDLMQSVNALELGLAKAQYEMQDGTITIEDKNISLTDLEENLRFVNSALYTGEFSAEDNKFLSLRADALMNAMQDRIHNMDKNELEERITNTEDESKNPIYNKKWGSIYSIRMQFLKQELQQRQ